ncbi:LLM class flavin-dependent oxidoreductase [Panacibacter sp. DH6]|uniref:LLM class flavin-dependent oxidoreductase n=1 Tax=Panacibacter microcysteis TaxID=2793269 RepID=A0A931GX51_9BACT|nr:LLM class flavin-dependent oxidoreductase [Panacibacter microcysteis]MBG9377368.1 LLM class flavin-dependent oxidoreductase [Panacibacter microcysteis]
MELGISTFVELTPDPATGSTITPYERFQNLLEEVKLADQLGLDVFAIGEHHRPDYLVSSPATVLAAAATVTKNIRLSSAVSVLSSDDPVRVFQQFATLDLISGGRAEIMAGRGSFIESFPLFGYDLDDYNTLFEEKLKLLVAINNSEKVTWKGKHRAPIDNLGIYPRPYHDKLPIWIAIGGTPASVYRAAKLGLPLTIAIIGGKPEQFVPHVNYYKEEYAKAGHDAAQLQLCINSHAYIADDSKQAADEFFPVYAQVMSRIGKERGWPPTTRDQFEYMRSPVGALLVGSPQQVTDKILYEHELFGNTRFMVQFSVGTLPHKQMMHAIELFGTVVAPAVKKALA